jgi:hypothetical protein
MDTGRYSIYDMLEKNVHVLIPPRFGGGEVNGVLEKVYRDVIQKTIEMNFHGNVTKYVFREPSEIYRDSDTVTFIYKEMVEDKDDFGTISGETEHIVATIMFEVRTI